jgi:hypothetical protein
VIHLVMAPVHAGQARADGLGFAAVGWAQIGLAVLLATGAARRPALVSSILLDVGVLGLWLWSRTTGLPFGSHAGEVEAVSLVDGLAAGLEVAAVMVAVALLVAPEAFRPGPVLGAVGAVAVLALTTVVLVDPGTASHGDEHAHGGELGHGHGDGSGLASQVAEMARLDRERCDLAINPTGYWEEAAALGVDTYAGGAMAPHVTDDELAGLEASRSEPGTPGLDALVSATDQAGSGEGAAAAFVSRLAMASEEDYERWTSWMLANAVGASQTGAVESGGHDHGSHAGPSPWIAMTDRNDCDRLVEELERARSVALAHPKAADATAAGYTKVTGYVPGIAAHYMDFGAVDGTFDLDRPEMLLYDGEGPDASIVGLSYYLIQPGDAEPTQGFTGPNDHYHRHVGLCMQGTMVIGDSTTTAQECAARGGAKAGGGSAGWMNHVWVVPGCESPWGMFSGASPLLDSALSAASGTDGGGCAGSSGRERYDLSPGRAGSVPMVDEVAEGD